MESFCSEGVIHHTSQGSCSQRSQLQGFHVRPHLNPQKIPKLSSEVPWQIISASLQGRQLQTTRSARPGLHWWQQCSHEPLAGGYSHFHSSKSASRWPLFASEPETGETEVTRGQKWTLVTSQGFQSLQFPHPAHVTHTEEISLMARCDGTGKF